MTAQIRLKGRSLQMGNTVILTMTLAVTLLMLFSVNLMAAVYRGVFMPQLLSYDRVKLISLALSVMILAVCRWVLLILRYGADRYVLKKAQGLPAGSGDIFYYFRPRRAFGLRFFAFRLGAVKASLLILCHVPAILTVILLLRLSFVGTSAAVLAIIAATAVAFFMAGLHYYRRMTASLFPARYYYISGKTLNFRQLISASQLAMKDNQRLLHRTVNSFAGWFLLCLFVLPIGYVWGYFRQTMAVLAVKFMGE
ncbi:MAG: hypothetical protein PUB43_08770 [Oscillospiraceae bacterium]|nr:hypothetical protein [Oscillospiraceae bacterium]